MRVSAAAGARSWRAIASSIGDAAVLPYVPIEMQQPGSASLSAWSTVMQPPNIRRAVFAAILLIMAIGIIVAIPQRDRLIRWATFD
jgi:hypothetical protein